MNATLFASLALAALLMPTAVATEPCARAYIHEPTHDAEVGAHVEDGEATVEAGALGEGRGVIVDCQTPSFQGRGLIEKIRDRLLLSAYYV